MTKNNQQSGFTAVELLITLFIAAAFLMSGYQLFTVIIKNSGEARAQTRAGNEAYNYLQQYKSDPTLIKNPCVINTTTVNNQSKTVDGLVNVFLDVNISCPYSNVPTLSAVSKITVTIRYNNPQLEVKNSTYATP